MRVLVTGLSGFAGGHFLEFLLDQKKVQVIGIERSASGLSGKRTDRLDFYECDVRDSKKTDAIIKRVKPDRVFHLAALSHVQESWASPSFFYDTNVLGQLNLLEALRRHCPKVRFHAALSSEEYGETKRSELPIVETNPLRPLNPYAVTKIAQDYMAYQYFKNFGMHTVRTRAFNHIGPGQKESFAVSSFAMQVARIEKGRQKAEIRVGNLKSKRDFTDVRDVVRGYWLALEKGEAGEVYNICSNRLASLESILQFFLKQSRVKVRIVKDPARLRPSDCAERLGDYKKFHKRTGWKPEIPAEETLKDILNHWRQAIGSAKFSK